MEGKNIGRIHLVDLTKEWKYEGVLHETIYFTPKHRAETLEKIWNISTTDGTRSKNPQKYLEDACVLEKALLQEPHNSRYVFYLAQSYRDAGKYDLALKNYERRSQIFGSHEENFWTLLEIGRCQEMLKMPDEVVIQSYHRSYCYRNMRFEPLYYLAQIFRNRKEYQKAYQITKIALELPTTQDILFVQQWMQDWGLPLELSVSAFMLGNYEECREISLALLKQHNLPSYAATCIQNNLGAANSKILEKMYGNFSNP